MSDTLGFRKINEIEKQIIITSFSNISTELPQIIENLKIDLYISTESLYIKNKFPNIFLILKDQVELLKTLDVELLKTLDNDKIISAGLYFGFIKKGNFYLSLEGAEFLYKNNVLSDLKKINVNDKGEKSILYGNNILKNIINTIPDSLKQNDILLIFNKNDEIIALARSKYDHQKIQQLKPKEIIAINLNDKGYYLRKNQ